MEIYIAGAGDLELGSQSKQNRTNACPQGAYNLVMEKNVKPKMRYTSLVSEL